MMPPIRKPSTVADLFQQVLFLGEQGARRLGLPDEQGFEGPDGKRRWEIDDTRAQMKVFPGAGSSKPLRDVLVHPDLFAAYPDLSDAPFSYRPSDGVGGGAYDPTTDSLFAGAPSKKYPALGTLLHEIQHAIQKREGFTPGSNPLLEMLRAPSLSPEEARLRYERAIGEVEARDVEERWRDRRQGKFDGRAPKLRKGPM